MEGSHSDSSPTERSIEHYLPATIQHSTATTRLEEFLTTVFRRRGTRYVVRRD